MISIGIDAGIEYTKVAVLLDDGQYKLSVHHNEFYTSAEIARRAIGFVLNNAGISEKQVEVIAKTGISRHDVEFSGKEVSDIVCLCEGAHMMSPEQTHIMDAGVRKFSAIHVEKNKLIKTASMDKCASGAGACLNMVSSFLHLDLQTMNDMYFNATQYVELETKCAVFAESEIISLIHKKIPVEVIVRGVFIGLARRCQSSLFDIGVKNSLLVVGGVSKIPAFLDAIEQVSQASVITVKEPQALIALGAASLAKRLEAEREC